MTSNSQDLNYVFSIRNHISDPGRIPVSIAEAFRIARLAGHKNARTQLINALEITGKSFSISYAFEYFRFSILITKL